MEINVKPKQLSISVGYAGAVEVKLPLLKFGSGEPKLLILVGLHGDETSGYFVITRLLDQLELSKGTLSIIMAANPLAQALQQRWDPINNRDVNRAFPGRPTGEFTDRLAAALLRQAKGCDCDDGEECHCVEQGKAYDCVIDFHTFNLSRMRTTAIFMNHGKRDVREKSLTLIRAFAPECIWQLDTRTEEQQQWAGSMGPEMAGQGIVNFAVELPASFWADDIVINKAVEGMLRVLHEMNMVDTDPPLPEEEPVTYSRDEICADEAGIWLPRSDLLEAVKAGEFPQIKEEDIIGQIVDLATLEKYRVKSNLEGLLPVLLSHTIVRVGDTLSVVGTQKPWGMLADDTVKKIATFVQGLDWPNNTAGISTSNQHLERVARIATYLADEEGKQTTFVDRSICKAGAWMHTLGLNANNKDTASWGFIIAKSFLRALGEKDVDMETRERILHCIRICDHKLDQEYMEEPETLEAKIVHDAEILDKSGPLGVVQHTWILVRSDESHSAEDILDSLHTFFEQREQDLLTRSGRQLAEKLDDLYSEALRYAFEDKDAMLPMITHMVELVREGMVAEEVAVEITEQYDNDFARALDHQLNQIYLPS